MSSFKIEPLADHEWGYRAAVRLMWHHRVVLIPLTLAALVFGHVIPAQLDGLVSRNFSFSLPGLEYLKPQQITDLIINSAMIIAIVTLYLKSAGAATSWRTAGIGLLVIMASEFAGFVGYRTVRAVMEALEHPAAQILIYFAMIALVIAYVNFTFCLAAQVLIDGKMSLARSYKGVARREWRLWFSMLLLFALAVPIWAVDSMEKLIGEHSPQAIMLLPYVEGGFNSFVWALSSMAAAALSTIWFLHPRVRPPEESTTWEVPSLPQAQ
jgi:hypothetical protein